MCECVCAHDRPWMCVCVSPVGRTPHCRDRHCSTIPPLLSCRHFTHAGANAIQKWRLALCSKFKKSRKEELTANGKRKNSAKAVKFWASNSGSERARTGKSGVCMPAFKFCPCVYPVQRTQRYLGESGGGKGEQRCKKWQEKKERENESGENGEALQTEMNAMDCSQRENDGKEGKRDGERKGIN